MTEEEKQQKRNELWKQIVDNTITEKEAVQEYMKIGYTQDISGKIYREIRGEAITASYGGCIE